MRAAEGGGENVPLSELIDYLGARSIAYDISALSKAVNAGTVQVVPLGMGECPPEQESYLLEVSEDSMTVTARFYPPPRRGSVCLWRSLWRICSLRRLSMV